MLSWLSFFTFYSVKDLSSWDDPVHIQSRPFLLSSTSLEKKHIPRVYLLGDSKSSQVDSED